MGQISSFSSVKAVPFEPVTAVSEDSEVINGLVWGKIQKKTIDFPFFPWHMGVSLTFSLKPIQKDQLVKIWWPPQETFQTTTHVLWYAPWWTRRVSRPSCCTESWVVANVLSHVGTSAMAIAAQDFFRHLCAILGVYNQIKNRFWVPRKGNLGKWLVTACHGHQPAVVLWFLDSFLWSVWFSAIATPQRCYFFWDTWKWGGTSHISSKHVSIASWKKMAPVSRFTLLRPISNSRQGHYDFLYLPIATQLHAGHGASNEVTSGTHGRCCSGVDLRPGCEVCIDLPG